MQYVTENWIFVKKKKVNKKTIDIFPCEQVIYAFLNK